MSVSLSLFAPRVLLATSFPALVQGVPGDTCRPVRVHAINVADAASDCEAVLASTCMEQQNALQQ